MIKVSVIIPVYNTEKHIKECIESLITQTLSECEFIFINDGSNDNSQKIIETYQAKDSRIILINQENQGVSVARNNGLKIAKGKYIGFVDADDFLNADTLTNFIKIEKNADVFLYDYNIFKNNELERINNESIIYYSNEDVVYDFLTWKLKIIIGSFIIKKSYLTKNIIFFNEKYSYGEDFDFFTRMLYFSNTVVIVNESLVTYNINETSAIYKYTFKRFDVFFLRKSIYEELFITGKSEKIKLFYERKLLPESVIEVIALLCKTGVSFIKIIKFINKNEMEKYILNSSINDDTPDNLKIMIEGWNSNKLFFYISKLVSNNYYIIKVRIYFLLKKIIIKQM